MQAIPENWVAYWSDPECIVDVRLRVILNEALGIVRAYTSGDISQCNLEAQLAPDFSIGNACSAHLAFEVTDAVYDSVMFQPGQRIDFSVRLKLGENATDYVNQGVYYISEVSEAENGALSISAYDEMLSFENMFVRDDVSVQSETNFSDVLDLYTANNSISVDFSQFLDTYVSMQPGGSTVRTQVKNLKVPKDAVFLDFRTMLGSVAAIAGGNVFITKDNTAKLIRPNRTGSEYHFEPITGVTGDADAVRVSSADKLMIGSQYVYATGLRIGDLLSGTGWLIDARIDEDFGITRKQLFDIYYNMVDGYAVLGDKSARAMPVEATGATINPLIELGDYVYVDIGEVFSSITVSTSYVYKRVYVSHFSISYSGDCYGTVGDNVKSEDAQFSEFLVYQESVSRDGWFDAFGDQDGIIDGHNNNLYVPSSSANQQMNPKIIGKNTFTIDCKVTPGTYSSVARLTGAGHIEGTVVYRNVNTGEYTSVTIDANLRQSICPIYDKSSSNGSAVLTYDNKYAFPDSLVTRPWDANIIVSTSTIAFKKPNSQADGYEVLAEVGGNFSSGKEKQKPKSKIAQIDSGGTGQTGVTSTSTVGEVITAASGVTIGIARYSVWGKLATFYIRATPSAAKSGTWDVGTLPEGKRPADEAAFITGNEAVIGYITTAGVVKVVGSVSANANVYLKATYLLA